MSGDRGSYDFSWMTPKEKPKKRFLKIRLWLEKNHLLDKVFTWMNLAALVVGWLTILYYAWKTIFFLIIIAWFLK